MIALMIVCLGSSALFWSLFFYLLSKKDKELTKKEVFILAAIVVVLPIIFVLIAVWVDSKPNTLSSTGSGSFYSTSSNDAGLLSPQTTYLVGQEFAWSVLFTITLYISYRTQKWVPKWLFPMIGSIAQSLYKIRECAGDFTATSIGVQ